MTDIIELELLTDEKPIEIEIDDEAVFGGYDKGYTEGETAGYQKGHAEGEEVGYEKGKADGKQAEWEAFWDSFQDNGEPCDYVYSFGRGWKTATFKPKYDLKPSSAYGMFHHTSIGDLEALLKTAGVKLDMSVCTSVTYMFTNARCSIIPEINCTNFTSMTQMFGACWATTIRKLILRDDGTNTFSATFAQNTKLKNIEVEGVIGRSIDFATCPLTVASMKSAITHLKNYAGTTSEYTYKLTFSSTCWANLEADSTAPNGDTWKNYVYSLGWNYA